MSEPIVRIHHREGIVGVEKTLALHTVEAYCAEHGLSMDKLKSLIFDISDNVAMFMAPSGIMPNGLVNDIETRPVLVLLIEDLDGVLEIKQTEHTAEYLTA